MTTVLISQFQGPQCELVPEFEHTADELHSLLVGQSSTARRLLVSFENRLVRLRRRGRLALAFAPGRRHRQAWNKILDSPNNYGLAALRLDGRMLVGFGASANNCAFYLMNSSTVEAQKEELKDHDTSKGTIRFQADKPLPVALVRKLVKARIAENVGRGRKST